MAEIVLYIDEDHLAFLRQTSDKLAISPSVIASRTIAAFALDPEKPLPGPSTDEEIGSIEEGLADVERENTFTNEEVMAAIDAIFIKK